MFCHFVFTSCADNYVLRYEQTPITVNTNTHYIMCKCLLHYVQTPINKLYNVQTRIELRAHTYNGNDKRLSRYVQTPISDRILTY